MSIEETVFAAMCIVAAICVTFLAMIGDEKDEKE